MKMDVPSVMITRSQVLALSLSHNAREREIPFLECNVAWQRESELD